MAFDFLCNEGDGDMIFDSTGDFKWTSNTQQLVTQRLDMRLKTWKNQWSFNEDFGTPYEQEIMFAGNSIEQINAVFLRVIRQEPLVTSVKELKVSWDVHTRTYSITHLEVYVDDQLINIPQNVRTNTYPEPRSFEDYEGCIGDGSGGGFPDLPTTNPDFPSGGGLPSNAEIYYATSPEKVKTEGVMQGQYWESVFSQPSSCMIVDTSYNENSKYCDFSIVGRTLYQNHVAQAIMTTSGVPVLANTHGLLQNSSWSFTPTDVWEFKVELKDDFTVDLNQSFSFNMSLVLTNGTEVYVNLLNWAELADDNRSMNVSIPMEDLHSGFDDTQSDWNPVVPSEIAQINFNVPSPNYTLTPDLPNLGDHHFEVRISNLRVKDLYSGGLKTAEYGLPAKSIDTGMGIATSFDDDITTSPRKLIEHAFALGYKRGVNHYIGISNYPALIWDATHNKFTIDTNVVVDPAVIRWHQDFLNVIEEQRLKFNWEDIPIILSFSFEMFIPHIDQIHDDMLQRGAPLTITSGAGSNVISVTGDYSHETLPNPFLGGTEYRGLFNPDNEYSGFIEYSDGEGGWVRNRVTNQSYNGFSTFLGCEDTVPAGITELRGKVGLTGYIPPSGFISPFSEKGRLWLVAAFQAMKAGINNPREGKGICWQVGEPWWWDGFFQNQMLCIYDEDTVAAAATAGITLDLGLKTPDVDPIDFTPEQEACAKFLRDRLGDFTAEPSKAMKAAHPEDNFSILTFIPQVFNETSMILRELNYPKDQWLYSTGDWDWLQIEAYDWLINKENAKIQQYSTQVVEDLGFPYKYTQNLLGFVGNPNPPLAKWRDMFVGQEDVEGLVSMNLMWSTSQVFRDNIVYIHKP